MQLMGLCHSLGAVQEQGNPITLEIRQRIPVWSTTISSETPLYMIAPSKCCFLTTDVELRLLAQLVRAHCHPCLKLVSSHAPPPPPLLISSTMEDSAAHVLHLLDLYWFRQQILLPPPPPTAPADPQPLPPLLLRRHRRALSHESAPAPSASLAIQPPRLRAILSGKEAPTEALFPAPPAACAAHAKGNGHRRQKRRRLMRKKSKSLTDLEFEELKGLIDLGFTFSHEEPDPRLLEIVPGLRRNKAGDAPDSVSVARPYLSEAWETRPEADLLDNWRFQATAGGGGVNLKDQLKSWAHAVASAVVR